MINRRIARTRIALRLLDSQTLVAIQTTQRTQSRRQRRGGCPGRRVMDPAALCRRSKRTLSSSSESSRSKPLVHRVDVEINDDTDADGKNRYEATG